MVKLNKILIFGTLLVLLIGGIPVISSATYSNGWANDPADCPAIYLSQDCSPDNTCGYDGSTTRCYNTTALDPPVASAVSNASWSGAFDGGYLINCISSLDGSAPYCDNSGNFWCDRDSTCYDVGRETQCEANKWSGDLDDITCSTCISGYNYCDGSYIDANGCEINDGESCTHTATGISGSCSGCGSTGTDSEGNSCQCIIAKSYFETGTYAEYATTGSNAFLWGKDYGSGDLINFTVSNGNKFVIDSSGKVGISTSTPQYDLSVVGTSYFSQPVIVGTPTQSSHAATMSYVDSSKYWDQSGSNLYPDNMSWSVGIGTSTPITALHIIGSTTISGNLEIGGVITGASYAGTMSAGNIESGSFGFNTGAGNYSFPASLAIGTTTLVGLPAGGLYVNGALEANGVLSFSDLGGGTVIDANGGDIVGVDKLTVATIDPIYQINGQNYATYAASFAGGVKEEYSSKARMMKSGYKFKYRYVIDFNKIEEGSDLWVWFKTIDFNKDNVEVVATAKDAPAVIWYEIEGNKIVFNAQYLYPASSTSLVNNNIQSNEEPESIEFSYRLTGKRFDWRKHPTKIIMNGKPLLIIP